MGVNQQQPNLFRHRGFMLMWGGQTISVFGTAVSELAIPTAAIFLLGASAFQIGILNVARFIAFPIFGLFAGVWVDRLHRRRVMIVADVVRAIALGSIPILAVLHALTLAQLFAVTAVVAIASVFFDVAYQAYLPSLVSRDAVLSANARLEFSNSAARTGGAGLAGILIQIAGAPLAIALDAASFVVSAVSLIGVRAQESIATGATPRFFGQLREGLTTVIGSPVLRGIAVCTGLQNLGWGMFHAVFLVFVYRDLHLTPAVIGIVMALSNLGFVGALLSTRMSQWIGVGPTLVVTALGASIGMGIVPLAAVAAPIAVLFVALLVITLTASIYNITQVSLRQTICGGELQGRVNATMRTIIWSVLPLGALIGGALGTWIGTAPTILVGFGVCLCSLAGLFGPGAIWRLRRFPSPLIAPSFPEPAAMGA
ncbi:MAG: MFS transporter [Candidatus Eremiobacteraeota bacterium]|nr:MFS transporter [Candidatus Eremiobacteraeota bacterium]